MSSWPNPSNCSRCASTSIAVLEEGLHADPRVGALLYLLVNCLGSAETASVSLSREQTALSSALPLAVNSFCTSELRETALIKICQSKVNFQSFLQMPTGTQCNHSIAKVIGFCFMRCLLTNSQSNAPIQQWANWSQILPIILELNNAESVNAYSPVAVAKRKGDADFTVFSQWDEQAVNDLWIWKKQGVQHVLLLLQVSCLSTFICSHFMWIFYSFDLFFHRLG